MKRRNFIAITSGSILFGGITYFLLSDKNNFERKDSKQNNPISISINADEREILFLVSLAPSGHNTQPWFVKYIEPNQKLNQSISINEPVQFILRTGYLKDYPYPVTLRRSVERFLRT